MMPTWPDPSRTASRPGLLWPAVNDGSAPELSTVGPRISTNRNPRRFLEQTAGANQQGMERG
jgi:hypothetical protein